PAAPVGEHELDGLRERRPQRELSLLVRHTADGHARHGHTTGHERRRRRIAAQHRRQDGDDENGDPKAADHANGIVLAVRARTKVPPARNTETLREANGGGTPPPAPPPSKKPQTKGGKKPGGKAPRRRIGPPTGRSPRH